MVALEFGVERYSRGPLTLLVSSQPLCWRACMFCIVLSALRRNWRRGVQSDVAISRRARELTSERSLSLGAPYVRVAASSGETCRDFVCPLPILFGSRLMSWSLHPFVRVRGKTNVRLIACPHVRS